MLYIWKWFIELSNARGSSQNGPQPLSFTEIKNWSELTNTKLNQFELDTIKEIDKIYIRVASNVRH